MQTANLILLREFVAAKQVESRARIQGMCEMEKDVSPVALASEQGREAAYQIVYNLIVEVLNSEQ